MKRNYKYNIGDVVINKYGEKNKILELTTGNRGESAYICKCSKGHVFSKLQTKILTSCPYCTNIIVEKGINDISTTNKELFDMLLDKEFGYTHCETSQEKTDWKCPTCHNIIYNKMPYLVKQRGLCCPNCSDGISYGEKFVSNLLNEINVDFIYQLSSKNSNWCGKYKYDFYVPSIDTIIEVMGLQHYKDCSWSSYDDVHKNDIAKKELAVKNVLHYVTLDIRYSTLEYVKQSILRSELDDLLELYSKNISWKEIHKRSISSILNVVVDKYNNVTKDINELSKILKLSNTTITRYLKNANKLGMCDYDAELKKIETLQKNHSKNSERTSKPIICINDGNVFKNSKIAKDISSEIYGKHLNNINAVCLGKYKSTKGLVFRFITRSEFNRIKRETPNKAFGDLFIDVEEVSA